MSVFSVLFLSIVILHIVAGARFCDEDGPEVSVVFAADHKQWIGLLTAILSVRRNAMSRCAHRLHFYVFVTLEEEKYLKQNIFQCLQDETEHITIVAFDPTKDGVHKIFTDGATKRRGLAFAHNFVRFYFHTYLEKLDKIIYLDADMLIEGDVISLYDSALVQEDKPENIIAAAQRIYNETYVTFVNVEHNAIRSRVQISPQESTFNAGLMVMRLDRWRSGNVTQHIEMWMALHEEFGDELWTLGSQPPLLLALHHRVEWLDEAWNFRAASVEDEAALRKVKVLHFNGGFKPWFPLVNHNADQDDERAWKRLTSDRWLFYNKRMWDADCKPAANVMPLTLWQDAFNAEETVTEVEKEILQVEQQSHYSLVVCLVIGAIFGYVVARKTTPNVKHEHV